MVVLPLFVGSLILLFLICAKELFLITYAFYNFLENMITSLISNAISILYLKPMALDQVLSDRDSEDEVDDDIADLEDRRVRMTIL